jgi:hypothetical protein
LEIPSAFARLWRDKYVVSYKFISASLRVCVKFFYEFSAQSVPAVHPISIQSTPRQAGGRTRSIAAWQIATFSAGGAADSSPRRSAVGFGRTKVISPAGATDKTVRLFSAAPAGA